MEKKTVLGTAWRKNVQSLKKMSGKNFLKQREGVIQYHLLKLLRNSSGLRKA